MVAVPWEAPAVTRPVEGSTESTAGAELVQTSVGLRALMGGSNKFFFESPVSSIRALVSAKKKKTKTHLAGETIAVSCSVCVGFKIVETGALMVTLATLITPVAVVVIVLPSASVAVMTEGPLPTAVSRPVESMVTFAGLELVQVIELVG